MMKTYTQGISQDGPVILVDGRPMTPEEIVAKLNDYESKKQELLDWSKSYPESIFPKTSFTIARHVLSSHGISIDSLSAYQWREASARAVSIITDKKTGDHQ